MRISLQAPAMIRFVFRFLGLWILAAAFILFIYDGARSIADNALRVYKVGDLWSSIHQNSLLLLQPAIERHVAPWLWTIRFRRCSSSRPGWCSASSAFCSC